MSNTDNNKVAQTEHHEQNTPVMMPNKPLGPNWKEHPEWGFSTRQIHAGFSADPVTGAQTVPIYATNAYLFPSAQEAADRFALKSIGPIYTRLGNPTNDAIEQRLASLEGGVGALLTSSGQAAGALALLTLASEGSNIVASSSVYGGTFNLLAHTLPRYGVQARFVSDSSDIAQWRELADEKTVAFFGEMVPNPQGDVFDLEPVAGLAQELSIPLIIDNTVPTPYLCRPLQWGANIVIHSVTKYLSGHGSVMAGAIIDGGTFDFASKAATRRFPLFNTPDPSYHGLVYAKDFGKDSDMGANLAFILKCRVEGQRDFGFAASPFNAFLIGLGLDTLSLRMERHLENATKVAGFLANVAQEEPDLITTVRYSSLPQSPYWALAQKYTPRGAGALLNFDLKGGLEAGKAFVDALDLHSNVANIGDVRSLVIHPASTTHSQLTTQELAAQGICAGTVRLAVGLEDIADILADLEKGLAAARSLGHRA